MADPLSKLSGAEGSGGGMKNKGEDELENGFACRICLGDEDDEHNHMITPCKCAGTMKYIH